MLLWKGHIRQLIYQKTKFCVVNLRVVISGNQRIKGFEKKGKQNIGIKNCSATLRIYFFFKYPLGVRPLFIALKF